MTASSGSPFSLIESDYNRPRQGLGYAVFEVSERVRHQILQARSADVLNLRGRISASLDPSLG